MYNDIKENLNVNTKQSMLALEPSALGKTKQIDKKKQKSNSYKEKTKSSGVKNGSNFDFSASAHFQKKDQRSSSSSKYQGKQQKQRQQADSVKSHYRNNKKSSELKIIIDSQDMEICKKTAIELHLTREAVSYDLSLQQHLNMVAYASNHFMLEQQQKAFYMQERIRQQEIAKWLSTKSEDERSSYLERLKKGIQ